MAETAQLFKCLIKSVKYIFVDGSEAIFVNGRYATTDESKIAELKSEIAKGHPHIYIDDKEEEIPAAAIDPIATLREKILAQATKDAGGAQGLDLGNTEPEKLQPANSATVAQGAAASDSTSADVGAGTPVAAGVSANKFVAVKSAAQS